jgi:hypothetical protein
VVSSAYGDDYRGELSECAAARNDELWESYRTAFDVLEKNYLLISPNIIDLMQGLQEARLAVDYEDYEPTVHEKQMDTFEKWIPLIVEAARSEVMP